MEPNNPGSSSSAAGLGNASEAERRFSPVPIPTGSAVDARIEARGPTLLFRTVGRLRGSRGGTARPIES